ncbi:MAG: flagellar hook capping protein [Anaerolineae bacterium]|nr:flagellar hook capping protein [Anaerolineae bacterium]
MQVDSTSPISSKPVGENKSNQYELEADGFGQDAFMKLLLAQLKNQDPLKPMEDKEFIAQLAQFNSLNQLSQINTTLGELMTAQTLSQGSALIGKTVTGLSDSNGAISGIVSGLKIVNDKVFLDVDGQSIPLDMVNSIELDRSINNDQQNQSTYTPNSAN